MKSEQNRYWIMINEYFLIASFFVLFQVKSRGPILRVTSSKCRSVCVKQALNTRRWLVDVVVTWHSSYKITTLITYEVTHPKPNYTANNSLLFLRYIYISLFLK